MNAETVYLKGSLAKNVESKNRDDPNYAGTFILTDETEDRDGDIILARGLDVKNFRRNPIALWQHLADRPVGFWKSVRRDGTRWLGDLIVSATNLGQMAKQLVDEGTLRAVSVGFRPKEGGIDANPNNPRGLLIKAAELFEVSLVSVPSNPNAIRIAKGLNLSEAERGAIFRELAAPSKSVDEDVLSAARKRLGLSSFTPPTTKQEDGRMSLSKRIEEKRAALSEDTAALAAATDAYADDPTEENEELVTQLTKSVETTQVQLDKLEAAERALMKRVADDLGSGDDDSDDDSGDDGKKAAKPSKVDPSRSRKQFGDITVLPRRTPAHKDYGAGDIIAMKAAAKLLAHIKQCSTEAVLRQYWPKDLEVMNVVLKADTEPATTTNPTWAGEFLGEQVQGWIDLLRNNSLFGALSARGQSYTFPNGINSISVPRRLANPKLNAPFIGENQPIRVGEMGIDSVKLAPMKVGVITSYTNEIERHTGGQIVNIIRDAILRDTVDSVDAVLVSAAAEVAGVSPPGLRDGVTPGTSAGDTVDNIITDWKALQAPFVTSDTSGEIVALINPARMLGLSTVTNAVGIMQFAADVANGVLMGTPLLVSANNPAEEVTMLDARDYAFAAGAPTFSVSNTATLHMEDTAPQNITEPPTPTVAAPVRSMFQIDAVALRMTQPMTWKMTRDNRVSGMDSVTW